MIRSSQKPRFLKVIPSSENSIVVKGDDIAWNNPWHYHPELELLYVIKGKGTNFIGNSIRSIEEGELLLLGKNLPHTRQRDPAFYTADRHEMPETIVIQFREDFLGERFFMVKEFAHIKALISRASRGLKFYGATKDQIAVRLENIRNMKGAAAILALVEVLDILARTEEVVYLNPANYVSSAHEKSSQEINKVYNYTIEHFRKNISLAEVAALTNHSVAAFCRFFKTRTRKSYFQYLIEIRIAYACEQLMEGNMDVTRVCFVSGFNNLSNFHRQFKKVMKETPGEYRARSLKKVVAICG